MARTWVEQVNEDRMKDPRFNQPASDRVMQMQVAPLTQKQQDFIQQYEVTPTAPTYPAMTPPGRRRYDETYPKGPGSRPVYPDPGGLYKPGGPENPPSRVPPRPVVRVFESPPDRPGAESMAASTPGARGLFPNTAAPPQFGAGEGGGTMEQRGYGPGYVAPPSYQDQQRALPTNYGPDDGWAFRDRIRGGMEGSSYGPNSRQDIFIPQGAGGKPGDKIINEYGPGFNSGYGTTRVMATADKTGRFNQFSDVPGAPTGPGSGAGGYNAVANDPYGIMADLRQARQRASIHTPNRINFEQVLAQKRVNTLRQQMREQGALGVQQRHQNLLEESAYPTNVLNNYMIQTLKDKGVPGLEALQAARAGRSDVHPLQMMDRTLLFRSGNVPTTGGEVSGRPAPAGTVAPISALPTFEDRRDMGFKYDPEHPYR